MTTYVLNDCTTSLYIGEEHSPQSIYLLSGVYITRIELFTETYITQMKICTSSGECHGPYGSSFESEPTTVFEKNNSVIKAFYGYSGSWLDAKGVYYEDAGASTNTCS